jgi:DNA polymerase III subunit epsilon
MQLKPRVTEAEREAHRRFIETLGEGAIWRDYLPSTAGSPTEIAAAG